MVKQFVTLIHAGRAGRWIVLAGVLLALFPVTSCKARPSGGQESLLSIAEKRGLTPEDAQRAVKTFVPPGSHDEFMLFASGGHSGQVHVIGVPSMRLLRTIAVFTPEPWQGTVTARTGPKRP